MCALFSLSLMMAQPQQLTFETKGGANASATPEVLATGEHFTFFSAYTNFHGRELWRSDGTPEGTVIVADLAPGSSSSLSSYYGSRYIPSIQGDTLYFIANDRISDSQIWRTDGTKEGTQQLTHISSGTFWSPVAVEDGVFFLLSKSQDEVELWGTDSNDGVVKKLVAGLSGSPTAYRAFAHKGDFYFWLGSRTTSTYDLWRSDGTAEGTLPILQNVIYRFNGFLLNTAFDPFYEYDGALYGIFETEETPRALYRLEGTEVVEVKSIPLTDERSYSTPLFSGTELNDLLYLYLIDPNDHALRIIETDGTTENTREVLSRDNIREYEYPLPSNLVATDGMLYFTYLDDSRQKTILARLDPNTGQLDQLYTIGSSGYYHDVDPNYNNNVRLYNMADDQIMVLVPLGGERGIHVFKDGELRRLDEDVDAYFPGQVRANQFYYRHERDSLIGTELWSYHANDSVVTILKDINKSSVSAFNWMLSIDDQAILKMTDDEQGDQFWSSDGTLSGTRFLLDPNPEKPSSIGTAIPFGNQLLFMSNEGEGPRPWVTSASSTSAQSLLENKLPEGYFFFRGLAVKDEWAYFYRMPTNTEPAAIYLTDGTPAFTFEYYSVPAIEDNGQMVFPRVVRLLPFEGGIAYVQVYSSNWELVIIPNDGQLNAQSVFSSSLIFYLRSDETGKLFFLFEDENRKRTIGCYNPTDGVVSRLDPGIHAWEEVISMSVIEGKLLFFAENEAQGQELWITDGTDGNTSVLDIYEGPQSGLSEQLRYRKVGNTLYFPATDGINGQELWRYDATTNEVEMLADILPGAGSSSPIFVGNNGEWLYFTAYLPETGRELWRTDGTAEGTQLLVDILEGPQSSNPGHIEVLGNALLMSAQTVSDGRQVWRYDLITDVKEQIDPSKSLLVYPNPSSDVIRLKADLGHNVKIEIFNHLGQLVTSRKGLTQAQEIPIHQLTPGAYTIKVLSEGKYSTAKFVKSQ